MRNSEKQEVDFQFHSSERAAPLRLDHPDV